MLEPSWKNNLSSQIRPDGGGNYRTFVCTSGSTLLHYILGWLLFSSYVLVFYSESLERNDIPCTSGYKTSCPFNFNLMEIHSTEFTPVGLTFKMVMCDQPKRHHKGKFLKEENVLVYYLGFRKKLSDMMVLLRVNPISLSYPFPFPYPFVLPLALVPRNRVVSARGVNIPL